MYLIKPETALGLRMYKYLQLKDDWIKENELLDLAYSVGYPAKEAKNALEELRQTVSIGQKERSFRYYTTDEIKLISNLEWFDELPE